SRASSAARAAGLVWAAVVSEETGLAAGVGWASSLLIGGTASIQGGNPANREAFPRLSRNGVPPSREVLGQDLGEEREKAALVIRWRHASRGLLHRLRRQGHGAPQPRRADHLHVVLLVADGNHLLEGHAQMGSEKAERGALR